MTRSERPETRKSFTAAFIAGLLGYFFGWWLENNWVSYISFFTFGYLGYDFRRVVRALRDIPKYWREVDELVPKWVPYPKLSFFFGFVGAFYFTLFVFVNPDFQSGGPINDIVVLKQIFINPGKCFSVVWNWVMTGNNLLVRPELWYMDDTWRGTAAQHSRVGMLVFAGIITVVAGYTAGFFSSTLICLGIKRRNEVVTFLGRHVAKILLSPIWLVVSCFIAPFVLLSRIGLGVLYGIHTFRRLATAIATAGAGTVYLAFVPFTVGLPIALTSIGCGLACGAVAWIVAYLLDGERVKVWLKTHLFAPFTAVFPPLDFGLARKSV